MVSIPTSFSAMKIHKIRGFVSPAERLHKITLNERISDTRVVIAE
jgi:hypothetical protein